MIYYVPLEPYIERYTEWLSTKNGLWETFFKMREIEYLAIRPESFHGELKCIKKGQVLDVQERCKWALEQVQILSKMLCENEIKDGSTIFFEDFWHPGIESLPYLRDVLKKKFSMFAFIHAQSVDPYDFTFSMRHWMRYFELGIAKCLDGIFVNCSELKELLLRNKIDLCPIYSFGHMFSPTFLQLHYPLVKIPNNKERTVVFSSRWDEEKRPEFFCNLVEKVCQERKDVNFVVCSGFQTLRSNNQELLTLLNATKDRVGSRLKVLENLKKEEYYQILANSKVQFNCADQDWISYTLLEACTFECSPLYPNYLSFPGALLSNDAHLYKKNNLQDAISKLYHLLDEAVDKKYLRDILSRHNYKTLDSMCRIMLRRNK